MTFRPARRDAWPWVGLASAVAFLALGALVAQGSALAFDEPLAAAIRGLPVPVWTWQIVTALGGAFLAVVGTALVLAALLSRRIRLALIVAGMLIAASVFTHVVKGYVARARPPWEHLAPANGYSFPSGHTLNSTASYGLLAVISWRSRLAMSARRVAVVVCVALPLLVGLSRIALGVHYPSDVLGGWLAGLAIVALGATLIRLTGAMERDPPAPGNRAPTNAP